MRTLRLTRLFVPAACALALLAGPALAQTTPGTTNSIPPTSAPSTPAPPPDGTTAAPAAANGALATPPPTPATTAPGNKTGTPKIKLTNAEKFTTEAAAAASCPSDTVVWSTLNKKSRNFHLASSRYYGKTKHGSYVCEQAAVAAGFHQAKS